MRILRLQPFRIILAIISAHHHTIVISMAFNSKFMERWGKALNVSPGLPRIKGAHDTGGFRPDTSIKGQPQLLCTIGNKIQMKITIISVVFSPWKILCNIADLRICVAPAIRLSP
jgi:hypothetical protein